MDPQKNRVAKESSKVKVTFAIAAEFIERIREASQRSEPSDNQTTTSQTKSTKVNIETTLTTVTTTSTSTNLAMSEQNESAAWPKADAALTQVRKASRPDYHNEHLTDMLLGAP